MLIWDIKIVNIWEHQVGLYQGANMGLLKTVFEVNLGLFLKDRRCVRPLMPLRPSTDELLQHDPSISPFLRNPRSYRPHTSKELV